MNLQTDTSLIQGRIVKEVRHTFDVSADGNLYKGEISGAFHYRALYKSDYPTIGDWVQFRVEGDLAIIESVLPRKSNFSRGVSNRKDKNPVTSEQVIAANIDKMILVFALDNGRNFTRGLLERYLALTHESGAVPVVALNKTDQCRNLDEVKSIVEECAVGIECFYTSALDGSGLDLLKESLVSGETIAFIGRSGVGKSTIINFLSGSELMVTKEVRDSDKRGKHTTTHKQLITLENGVHLIDCPGLKEVELWAEEESIDEVFLEISDLAKQCRFKNCGHESEPGCAVLEALDSGELSIERYNSYLKMKREVVHQERTQKFGSGYAEKKKWKELHSGAVKPYKK